MGADQPAAEVVDLATKPITNLFRAGREAGGGAGLFDLAVVHDHDLSAMSTPSSWSWVTKTWSRGPRRGRRRSHWRRSRTLASSAPKGRQSSSTEG